MRRVVPHVDAGSDGRMSTRATSSWPHEGEPVFSDEVYSMFLALSRVGVLIFLF